MRLVIKGYVGRVHSPQFDRFGHSEISFYTNKNDPDESYQAVTVPKWLEDLIDRRVMSAREEGAEKARKEVREAIGVRNL